MAGDWRVNHCLRYQVLSFMERRHPALADRPGAIGADTLNLSLTVLTRPDIVRTRGIGHVAITKTKQGGKSHVLTTPIAQTVCVK